jgi:hypothetical protein
MQMNLLSAVQKHPIDEAKIPYFGTIKNPPSLPNKSNLKQRFVLFLTLFKKLLKFYKNLYFQAIRGEALIVHSFGAFLRGFFRSLCLLQVVGWAVPTNYLKLVGTAHPTNYENKFCMAGLNKFKQYFIFIRF